MLPHAIAPAPGGPRTQARIHPTDALSRDGWRSARGSCRRFGLAAQAVLWTVRLALAGHRAVCVQRFTMKPRHFFPRENHRVSSRQQQKERQLEVL